MSTPDSLHWQQFVPVADGAQCRFLCGPIIKIPIYPFPGLIIRAMTVDTVRLHQGKTNMQGGDIEYRGITESHAEILLRNGWEWE